MQSGEDDREVSGMCAVCGTAVASDAERSFGFGAGNVLCWDCAEARGGRYDAGRDRWETPPDLSGLSDEAYGTAPHEVRRGR